MPKYNTQVPPPAIFPSGGPQCQATVFSAEALTLGEFSQQVHLAPNVNAGSKGIRVVIDFSANPGNVEILVVESDRDIPGGTADYIIVPAAGDLTQASLASGPNGALTRLVTDLIPIAGQFVCLFVNVVPSNGGITCTARITRAN